MSIAVDEFGRPFIVLKEQEKQKRLKGLQALKANITAAKYVSNIMKTSLGPNGMDKIIIDQDNEVIVTNDGAEMLSKIEVKHEIAKLLTQLSRSQDEEIGDGTTGVVVLAGSLLSEAFPLVEKGIHPIKIAKCFDTAAEKAVIHLENISEKMDAFNLSNIESLMSAARTTLSSKLVKNYKNLLAEIAVKAILNVADTQRKDVNFEMIRIDGEVGSSLDKSQLIEGILLDKSMSHSQMPKKFINPKIALLTCAFEPPKPKTKHFVQIKSVEQFKKLYELEQQWFKDMVFKCKSSGANIVFCQWGFDDEANHLLLQQDMPAVRWVGGSEMESIAIATGAQIIGRFEEIDSSKLGTAGSIREITLNNSEKKIMIEKCPYKRIITIFLRTGNKMSLNEAKRCMNDSLCSVRNLILDNRICYGGGSCELSCSQKILEHSKTVTGLDRYGFQAFGRALETIPAILAENSGLDPISTLTLLKKAQQTNECPYYGVGINSTEPVNMKSECVYESLLGKRQQIHLATQLAKIILKTDDIIKSDDLDCN